MSKSTDMMELNSIMVQVSSDETKLKELLKFTCKQLIEIKDELKKINK